MPIRKHLIPFASALALLCTSAAVSAQSTSLVREGNLVYQGFIKVPEVSGNGFSYGGQGLAYNPANNSLFLVGHIYDQKVAELSIPALGGTASVKQPLVDSLAGKLTSIGDGMRHIGGNLVYNNKLITSAFLYYDGSGAQTVSHYSRPLTLSGGSVVGPARVGSMGAGFYSGYMGLIPSDWQSKLGGPALTGNCCLSIISRTSYGPAAFSFDPDNMTAGAKPLVYYTQTNQTLGSYGAGGSHPKFNGTTRIRGIVFPQGTASVLFFGVTGVGNYCYGEAAACGDPSNTSKGEHAYPYRAYVWAYNAADLAAVRAGTKQPWAVTPYASWEISKLGNIHSDGVGGASYDPATGRLFLSMKFDDGDRPRIHVFKIDNSVAQAVPAAPSNLSVQ